MANDIDISIVPLPDGHISIVFNEPGYISKGDTLYLTGSDVVIIRRQVFDKLVAYYNWQTEPPPPRDFNPNESFPYTRAALRRLWKNLKELVALTRG